MKSKDFYFPLIALLGFLFLYQLIDMFYLIGITREMSKVFFNCYFIFLFIIDLVFIYKIFTDLYFPDIDN